MPQEPSYTANTRDGPKACLSADRKDVPAVFGTWYDTHSTLDALAIIRLRVHLARPRPR